VEVAGAVRNSRPNLKAVGSRVHGDLETSMKLVRIGLVPVGKHARYSCRRRKFTPLGCFIKHPG